MEKNFTIEGVNFQAEHVVVHKTQDEWLKWAMPRHYEGRPDDKKQKFLTLAWEKAVAATGIGPKK